MRAAERVAFHRCRFQHLGGSGLELEYGTRHADITGNLFEDVSGNGIQVSGTDEIHHHPDDDRAIVFDNRITNNCVTNVAAEYHGCVGIWVGYADTTTIEHNTVYDLPYTAISVGWGWGTVDPGGSAGYTTPSTSRNNSVSYNHIHHFTQRLIDGGGIYTLSAQPGSVIRGNYIHDLVINHYDDSLVYLDEATRNYLVEDNVLCGTPSWWLKDLDLLDPRQPGGPQLRRPSRRRVERRCRQRGRGQRPARSGRVAGGGAGDRRASGCGAGVPRPAAGWRARTATGLGGVRPGLRRAAAARTAVDAVTPVDAEAPHRKDIPAVERTSSHGQPVVSPGPAGQRDRARRRRRGRRVT
jgi:hypothetical protein